MSCLDRSHIFLGFSKCGRYVLSYTSSSGDDDFSFYIYHLYWWEFNVHSKLKLVGWESSVPCLSTGSGSDCTWSFGEEASGQTPPPLPGSLGLPVYVSLTLSAWSRALAMFLFLPGRGAAGWRAVGCSMAKGAQVGYL